MYAYSNKMHLSLLDVISGRNVKRGVTGDVVINGELIPENFRCASGYVTQVKSIFVFLAIQPLRITFAYAGRKNHGYFDH